MFDYNNVDSVRAALYAEGIRVATINGSIGSHYYFYSGSINICTSDNDCRDKINQLDKYVSFLITTYLRIA